MRNELPPMSPREREIHRFYNLLDRLMLIAEDLRAMTRAPRPLEPGDPDRARLHAQALSHLDAIELHARLVRDALEPPAAAATPTPSTH